MTTCGTCCFMITDPFSRYFWYYSMLLVPLLLLLLLLMLYHLTTLYLTPSESDTSDIVRQSSSVPYSYRRIKNVIDTISTFDTSKLSFSSRHRKLGDVREWRAKFIPGYICFGRSKVRYFDRSKLSIQHATPKNSPRVDGSRVEEGQHADESINPPNYDSLASCAGVVCANFCAGCGCYWSMLVFRPPGVFWGKRHHNTRRSRVTAPADLEPPQTARVRARVRVRPGVRLVWADEQG